MIEMDLLSVIRRKRFRDKLPIRENRRRTGLSRNNVRKYLRSGEVEPVIKVPKRPSKLDSYVEKLSAWLRVKAGKSRKHRRTVTLMYPDLLALGFDCSYGRVARHSRVRSMPGSPRWRATTCSNRGCRPSSGCGPAA